MRCREGNRSRHELKDTWRCLLSHSAEQPYIGAEGLERLHSYRYEGDDPSPLYKHALSPLADLLVLHCCPSWAAPNLISFIGFLLVVSSHLLALYYSPTLSEPMPYWVHLYAGVMMFVNQTFDNMDGKQARRTNSSSALGLAFDHGCDAVHSAIGGMTAMASLQLGPPLQPLLAACCWLGGAAPFLFASWEHYHTGCLYLPVVNGPTEGMLLLSIVHLIAGAVPDSEEFWTTEVPLLPGVDYREFGFFWHTVGVVLTCGRSIWRVATHIHGRKAKRKPVLNGTLHAPRTRLEQHDQNGHPDGMMLRKRTAVSAASAEYNGVTGARRQWGPPECSLTDALLHLVPWLCVHVFAVWWIGSGRPPGHPSLWHTCPRMCFYFMSLMHCKLVMHLQLCHVTGELMRPWRWTCCLSLGVLVLARLSCLAAPHMCTYEVPLLKAVCVAALFSLTHLVLTVVPAIAAELNIYVFSLQNRVGVNRVGV
ncbi:unnamed protein product [Vitrella brassicaformis CCMP3155]|uniref:Uncharacterized protein n=2 Tax=Vitrella brassicaformis TaxID=1169539 RepID=A0A0G4EKN3_VITBC|nr:unnamed protein product [Vitrella brassicaformis CCMP3155]|mmetsp:Transcript_36420/g.104386  ORF Transcript_36420/g.104386 Transcript_36420/m.104386 type:complete len:479 (+) Transcript_36420:55-1491(+)|eukprot:CEL97686.1 unnamed protein product [Vitrella brassicaformis CCMP3155]